MSSLPTAGRPIPALQQVRDLRKTMRKFIFGLVGAKHQPKENS